MDERQIKHYADKLRCETDAWDLKTMLENGESVIIVDARSPTAYAFERIPGAVNLPHRTMSPETTAHLDSNALIVTYCDGIGCNASTKGALKMAQLGFRVKELIGGLDWWTRDGYATEGEHQRDGTQIICGCSGGGRSLKCAVPYRSFAEKAKRYFMPLQIKSCYVD